MNIINENLYTSGVDIKGFTSNGVVKGNGELVMGAGTAKQVKILHPNLPLLFGTMLKTSFRKVNGTYRYGYLYDEDTSIIAVQTKYHYKDASDVELIEYSLELLNKFAQLHSNKLIGIPFPGIGEGKLNKNDVLFLLEALPTNVLVFEYEKD